ncbi:MAG: tape measure protein, partial [Treponema sp.]|nr:tape measure protein [Treponema sp.]
MADDKKTLELQIRIAAGEALQAVSSLTGEMRSLAGEARKLSESDGAAIKRTFGETRAAAEKAAASMKLFGASSGELRQAQARVKAAAVDLVTKGFEPQSEEVKKLIGEYKRPGKEADTLDRAVGSNVNSFGELKNALGSLAQVAAPARALDAIKDVGAFALSTADTFRTARNEFGILPGDMEAGAGLFNRIKAFNDKTPFSLDALTQATKVLLAAKVPLEDLQNRLTKFGDLSQGNSQNFTSYVTAFGKAAARGKVDMEVLNTYLNQGVPILTALGERFGVLKDKVAEMVSQGKVGFEDFSAALSDLAAEGGQYFGGMEQYSRSLAAMREGLTEAVNSLAASFGDMLLPAAIQVLETLTAITGAVNESPIAKGVFAGALVTVTGLPAAMAVKAAAAFAAQMKLNLAAGVLNPVVMAATVAVGVAAAAYTICASKQQEAAKEAENFALQQRQQKDAVDESAAALDRYARALANMTDEQIRYQIEQLNAKNNVPFRIVTPDVEAEAAQLAALYKTLGERRTAFIDSMFSGTQASKIQRIHEQLAAAGKYLSDPNLGGGEASRLQEIIWTLTADLEKPTKEAGGPLSEIDRAAAGWKEAWADTWKRFRAEQSADPFALINLEEEKKKLDAYKNYVRGLGSESENAAVLTQIDEYYAARRGEIAQGLKDKEERMMRELTESRVDDLEYELQETLKTIDALETRRIIAAA